MIKFSNLSKTALKTVDKEISYKELQKNIFAFTTLFAYNTDKIAIFSENRPEWIYAFYAGWQNNSTVVPVDFMASVGDVSFILNDCKPEVLFISSSKMEDIEEVLETLDYKPVVINLDEISLPDSDIQKEWKEPEDNEKTAVIIYTSGTTGSPKGVMISFTNFLANINEVCHEVPIIIEERQSLILLPLHHVFPLLGTMIAPLYVGASIAMSPSMQSSDLLDTLKNNQVAIMVGVPRLYELIYKGLKAKIEASGAGRLFYKILSKFPNRTLAKKIFKKVHEGFGGHLEVLVAGGAALSPEVGKFFKTLGFTVLEGYGMTEAAPMITFNRPGNFRIGTPGQKLNTVDIEIRDGEIVAKGPNVMKGYYNRPEETAQVLKDGWLYTGDVGYIDKDGFLYITGRKKEIIVLSNGKNINPVEIEDKLLHMSPYISDIAIHFDTDKLHALIVPDYSELAKAEIKEPEEYFKNSVIAKYNNHTSPYKRILQFTLLKTEIPRTRLGKIQRFKLAELLASPNKEKKTTKDPDSEEYKTIKVFIEEQTNSTISPDDHLEFDIALDSLGKLSLIDFIDNTFGVKIEEHNLLKFPSVKKLVEHIKDNKLRHTVENLDWSKTLKEKVHVKLPETSLLQLFIKSLLKGVFKLYFRFKVHNISNVHDGACVIAPNHQSFLDAMMLVASFDKKTLQQTYFYAKEKHVRSRFMKYLARKNNVIVMDINNELKESIQKLAEVLKKGKKVVIFPEGTRTKTGEIGDFKIMFSILSKEINVPVVPVAVKGAYEALPRDKKFPKFNSKISITYLPTIMPDDSSYEELSERVKKAILKELKK